MDYQDLALRFRSFVDAEFGMGTLPSEIDAAENDLGVRLPSSYRRFLEEFGWGSVGHLEILGLGPDVPSYLNLVQITESERREMQPSLSRYLVPVMNDGGGNLYCLNTESHRQEECPVVFWDHEGGLDQEAEPVAEDFATWLSSELDALQEELTS